MYVVIGDVTVLGFQSNMAHILYPDGRENKLDNSI